MALCGLIDLVASMVDDARDAAPASEGRRLSVLLGYPLPLPGPPNARPRRTSREGPRLQSLVGRAGGRTDSAAEDDAAGIAGRP